MYDKIEELVNKTFTLSKDYKHPLCNFGTLVGYYIGH